MTLFSIPRSVYEKIKAAAREEVYDAQFRMFGYDTSDNELSEGFHPREPEEHGVEVIEDLIKAK